MSVYKNMRTPEQLIKLLHTIFDLERLYNLPKFFICGGVFRSILIKDKIKDIDIFCPKTNTRLVIRKLLINKGWVIASDTNNAITFKHEDFEFVIQIIKLFRFLYNENISDVLDNFGLTVAKAGVSTHDIFNSVVHEDYIQDLALRRIVLTNTREPFKKLRRVLKYSRYGFNISGVDLIDLMIAIRKYEFYDIMDMVMELCSFYDMPSKNGILDIMTKCAKNDPDKGKTFKSQQAVNRLMGRFVKEFRTEQEEWGIDPNDSENNYKILEDLNEYNQE